MLEDANPTAKLVVYDITTNTADRQRYDIIITAAARNRAGGHSRCLSSKPTCSSIWCYRGFWAWIVGALVAKSHRFDLELTRPVKHRELLESHFGCRVRFKADRGAKSSSSLG